MKNRALKNYALVIRVTRSRSTDIQIYRYSRPNHMESQLDNSTVAIPDGFV